MEKQIKLFLEFLENDKRVSKNTLESYRRDIMQYADYIEENHMNYTKTSNEEIEDCFDPTYQIKNVDEVFKRVGLL